ncbi:MAG: hypothetical protein E6Q89_03205 [Bacteroidia bacterium]|nr:MAG: hypothetical protein E6Q89_03205 [Bacteroidia bacterium]
MKTLKYSLSVLLSFGLSAFAMAQSSLSSTSSSGGGAPIDGGITLLVGGIAGYGVKKLRDNHKKVTAEKEV